MKPGELLSAAERCRDRAALVAEQRRLAAERMSGLVREAEARRQERRRLHAELIVAATTLSRFLDAFPDRIASQVMAMRKGSARRDPAG